MMTMLIRDFLVASGIPLELSGHRFSVALDAADLLLDCIDVSIAKLRVAVFIFV
jgi:hypothetical protein